MAEPKREELRVQARRAILASVISPDNPCDKENALDELTGLVTTAGVNVVGTLVQTRRNPHPSTCFGSGKVEELSQLIKSRDAEMVIFDNNLSPAQGRNLEKETDTVIVDRSDLACDAD